MIVLTMVGCAYCGQLLDMGNHAKGCLCSTCQHKCKESLQAQINTLTVENHRLSRVIEELKLRVPHDLTCTIFDRSATISDFENRQYVCNCNWQGRISGAYQRAFKERTTK